MSLLVTTLVTSLTKQLAVLLLRHTLAALLNDGAHTGSSLLLFLSTRGKVHLLAYRVFEGALNQSGEILADCGGKHELKRW